MKYTPQKHSEPKYADDVSDDQKPEVDQMKTIGYDRKNLRHAGLWSDAEEEPEREAAQQAAEEGDAEPSSKYEKKNVRHAGLWSDDEEPVVHEDDTMKHPYVKRNITHDGLWSDEEEEEPGREKEIEYRKKRKRSHGLLEDDDSYVYTGEDDEPSLKRQDSRARRSSVASLKAYEHEVDHYKTEKKDLLQDGMWDDEQVAAMSDAEPEPKMELMEMESMVFVEEEEPENNNFWYFVGGAGVGLTSAWLFGGKKVRENIRYVPSQVKVAQRLPRSSRVKQARRQS